VQPLVSTHAQSHTVIQTYSRHTYTLRHRDTVTNIMHTRTLRHRQTERQSRHTVHSVIHYTDSVADCTDTKYPQTIQTAHTDCVDKL